MLYVLPQEQITRAIAVLRPLRDTRTASELRLLCERKAFEICREHKALKLILEITDLILEGISRPIRGRL